MTANATVNGNDLQRVLDSERQLGADMRTLVACKDGDLLLLHKDFVPHNISNLNPRDRPTSCAVNTQHETAQSLADYTNRFAKRDESVVYVSNEGQSITLVVDHHTPTATAWRCHVAHFAARLSDRYAAWKDRNGKLSPQEDFANWIEDHLNDIVFPEAATVLEVIETMQATMRGAFRKVIRRDTGASVLQFDNEITASAGTAGRDLEVPRKLKIEVPIFESSGAPVGIEVAMRYRISGGQVSWGFQMYGITEIEKKAWEKLVSEDFTNEVTVEIPTYQGSVTDLGN